MRFFLVLLLGLLAAQAQAEERIVDLRDSTVISTELLTGRIAESDFILLGEVHDNPHHHERRGELLAALKPLSPVLVAEHLEIGKTFASSSNLQQDLEAAGFNAKGWRWPLHQPLFESAVQNGVPLIGGNIPRETARDVVRKGLDVLPADLQTLITKAPLDADAQKTLDDSLIQGHCGHMSEAMLPGMRLAQRARDAAMFSALRHADLRPAILVAGNGHVRKDYGIPSLIRHHLPDAKYVSIGFIEDTPEINIGQELRDQYDYVWITEPAQRDDPCKMMK